MSTNFSGDSVAFEVNYGKGAESLCTTNSEGDLRSPEEFEEATWNVSPLTKFLI